MKPPSVCRTATHMLHDKDIHPGICTQNALIKVTIRNIILYQLFHLHLTLSLLSRLNKCFSTSQ